jgi:double-stranded uracil-DNA glycosylase
MGERALNGFAPVIDRQVAVLVLGSFPGEASLARGQYYGHPQNQFWRLVGRVIGEPLHEMPYEARLGTLLAHRIGVWDVIASCRRDGSLDSAIRDATHNDFARVTRIATGLGRVCFNGKTAGRLEPFFSGLGFETRVLPSSSPAHTLPFAHKLRAWRRGLATALHDCGTVPSHKSRATDHGRSC